MKFSFRYILPQFVLLFLGLPNVCAVEHVVFKRDGKERQIVGRLVVEAQDGGLLLTEPDGTLWAVTPDELVKHTSDEESFKPLSKEEISKKMLAELPAGFEVLKTAHYLIFYDTSKAYASWCGSLFERLYSAFSNYWTRKGFALKDPEFPLVAIVFSDKASYAKFAQPELGDASDAIVAYYSLMSNRITMFDLSGIEAIGGPRGRGGTMAQVNQILSQPEATQMVATIVHEATHQMAYNRGLQTRLSDCPLWFSEGISLFFETPDLKSAKGWSGIGAVNYSRLERFQAYQQKRPADSLKTLISTDERLRDTKIGLDAYAESWALTYFLIHQKPKEYVAYIKMLSQKKPLLNDTPEKRIEEFEEVFGKIGKLDEEFQRYIGRVK
jgi:hypothetical protein